MFDDDDEFFGNNRRRGGNNNQRRSRNEMMGGGMLSLFEDDPFFSGRGGGFGGFGNMGSMMQRMDNMMSGMQSGEFGDGNNGTFYSSSSVMTMSRGPDGKMQKYTSESQATNAGGERISQTKQAYSNNAGLDKVGWERTIGDRGTKIVKQRTRGSHEETTTKMFTGMDPDNETDFNNDWRSHGGRKALNDFSRQSRNNMQSLMGGMGNNNNMMNNNNRRSLRNSSRNYNRDEHSDNNNDNNNNRLGDRQGRGRFLPNNGETNYPSSRNSSRSGGYYLD